MQLAAFLPKHMDDVKLRAYLRRHNMYTAALSPYYMGENAQPGLYVGFAGVPEQKIRAGTERLVALLDAYKE
jgi:DNA-binding transcriptional MocR family regulator